MEDAIRMACCAALLLTLRLGAACQAPASKQVLEGECTDASYTAEGPLNSELAKHQSRFYCDSAVITTIDNHPGRTLVNFFQKSSKQTNTLGFAGKFEHATGRAESTMQVNTVYLRPGEATTATAGLCKTSFEDDRLKGLKCGVKVDEGGRRTTAIVVFEVAPNQSLRFETRPAVEPSGKTDRSAMGAEHLPDKSTLKTLPNGTKVAILPNGNKFEELPDGTTWFVLHPGGELLGVRVDLNVMPTASSFVTEMIRNLPKSDIVNAPLSEKVQLEGDCRSKTYSILGVLPYQGENGGGLPDSDLASGPENVVRRVLPGTSASLVFDVVCKKR